MPSDQKISTGLTTIRFDIRRIATIARFYISIGTTFRSKSEIINQIICDMEQLLLDKELVESFDKTDDANFFLTNIGMSFRHQATDRGYLKQLSIESLAFEKNSPGTPPDIKGIKGAIKENM